MPKVMLDMLSSKKVWSALIGVAAVLIGKIGWNVSDEGLWQIAAIIATLIGAQGAADWSKERAKIETSSGAK